MEQKPYSSIEFIGETGDGSQTYKTTFYPVGRVEPIKVLFIVYQDEIAHIQKWDTSAALTAIHPGGPNTW